MLSSCHNTGFTRKHKRGFNQWQWTPLIHSNSLSKHACSPGKAVKAVHRQDRKEIVSSFFFLFLLFIYTMFFLFFFSLSAGVLQKLITPVRHMRNLVLIKPQHCVYGVRSATASTGARSNWLSSQPVPISPVSVKDDLIRGVKILLNEAKMLIMKTRHCQPTLPPTLVTSLPPPPFSPWHLLPDWRLSTTTHCACHAAPLLQLAALLPAAPREACCWDRNGGKWQEKHPLCLPHMDGG